MKSKKIDEIIFNKAMDITQTLIDKGYVRAWFDWLEWVGLSALLYTAGLKLNSFILLLLGVISLIIVFFVGLAGVEKFTVHLLPSLLKKPLLLIFIVITISLIGLYIVLVIIQGLMKVAGV